MHGEGEGGPPLQYGVCYPTVEPPEAILGSTRGKTKMKLVCRDEARDRWRLGKHAQFRLVFACRLVMCVLSGGRR